MNRADFFKHIQKKSSFLCVGLDPDLNKIPSHLLKEKDPVFAFNRQIIEATHEYCVAYKPNLAFYEALGAQGWESLQKTIECIPDEIFTIADAKRGDIGNTSSLYAKAFFEQMTFDAITVAPYMGQDSITPFLNFEGKWIILLALTSNTGSQDFQELIVGEERKTLFEKVIETSQQWAGPDQMMYVVGATQAERLAEIRQLIPDHFLLIPGIGAQGGSLQEVAKQGMNQMCGLLVNASRSIIYAGNSHDFANESQKAARKIQEEMEFHLDQYVGR